MKSVVPYGPWVLIKVNPFPEKSSGGIYLPDGTTMERLSYASGKVIKVGKGYLNNGKKNKGKYTPLEVKEGDTAVFRGHLKEANKPIELSDDYCLIHARDIVGILDEGTLDIAAPYDN